MKKYALFLIIMMGSILNKNAIGQVHVNVNVNIGAQPDWGPEGYEQAEYYYLPDLDIYYWVPRRQFIYADGGRWLFAASLPARYQSYDLYRGYKVAINDPYPYRHCDLYRERYGRYRGWYGRQQVILDRSCRENDDDDDYQGHPGRHGRGHAYGHFKHHNEDD